MKNKSAYESIITELHVKRYGIPAEKRLILTMDIENTSQRRWSYSASVCTFNHNNPYPKSLTYFSFSFLLPLCQFLLKTWFQVLALKLCGN